LLDMNVRILRSMLAVGLFDEPPQRSRIDYAAHAAQALDAAQRGIVLLKNDGVLPLAHAVARIAVIGGHADAGVLSGGGSAAVIPIGGMLGIPLGGPGTPIEFFDRSSPLAAIRAHATRAAVSFDDGRYPAQAAALAKRAAIAIVFATQWCSEGMDLPGLDLPDGQDALVDAVAAANPRTIVVLETGNPVAMPWLNRVAAVAEAWYAGQRGGDAIANVLFGDVDASGRLPITFPATPAQLVHPDLPGLDELLDATAAGVPEFVRARALPPFSVHYSEGSAVGYRRFAAEDLTPLFAFGHGLSYTSFRYGGFTLRGGKTLTAIFRVVNTGSRTGTDTPQLYLTHRLGAREMRLLGWSNVTLRPGQSQNVTISADPRLLADFDPASNAWKIREGEYEASVGAASDALRERATAAVAGQTIEP
jgi:beta-glucosidase